MRWTASLVLIGCARVELPVDGSLSAEALVTLSVAAPRGAVAVGGGPDEADVTWAGTLSARGGTRAAAEARLAEAALRVIHEDGDASLAATLPRRTSLDLDVAVPATLPLEISVPRGAVIVEGMAGGVEVEASRVELWDVAGPVFAEVGGGSGLLRVRPAAGAGLYAKTQQGDLWIQIPIGLPYHLILEGPPDSVWQIGALGLTEAIELPGRFEGRAGDGSVPVRVETWGGVVTIEGF